MKHDFSSTPARGHVTLVGAGPGDPDLLTIKALKAIQSATVVLVDDLVNDAIVALASKSARIVYVGKRGGCKSTPQSFIEKLMVTAALEGSHFAGRTPHPPRICPRRRLRDWPRQAGFHRNRLACPGRNRAAGQAHLGDLHGCQWCGHHPARVDARTARRHTGCHHPECLIAPAEACRMHAGRPGIHH